MGPKYRPVPFSHPHTRPAGVGENDLGQCGTLESSLRRPGFRGSPTHTSLVYGAQRPVTTQNQRPSLAPRHSSPEGFDPVSPSSSGQRFGLGPDRSYLSCHKYLSSSRG